jgi:adenine-specific DNA-methyltransferase
VQSHALKARITKRITNAIPAVEAASNPKGPLQAALRADAQLFPAVFQALRKIDTDAFIREGRVYGGGLYKMEPKELGRLDAEPVLEAMGGWKLARQGMLFAEG